MNRIYIPTASPDDWRKFLAEPDKQWRSGYSARELAECWERSNGFPAELQTVFANAGIPALRAPELLLAIPEYQVALPDGKRPSQNDLFVLARAGDGQLVVMMIEGKVAEPFGETLQTWLSGGSAGKRKRLQMLCEILGLRQEPPLHLRYQLFHRAASALLTARRFSAHYALMIVHSFSPEHKWLGDYQEFLSLFSASGGANELVELPPVEGRQFVAGWVVGARN